MWNPSTARPIVSHVSIDTTVEAGGAVFIDRDGVINEQWTGKYVHSWQDFVFLPRTLDAFLALKWAGRPTFVVTNQGGVGRGFLSAIALDDIHDRMSGAIRDAGGRLDAIIHCPHPPVAGCPCRKPRPGMLSTLAERFGVRLEASVFIGDNVTDLEAGRDAGCNTILVGTGEGRRSAKRLGLPPFTDTVAMPVTCDRMNGLIAIAPNLDAAVAHFLAKHGQ